MSIASVDANEEVRLSFLEPTDSTLVQFLRYGFVGGCAFLCDFGILALAVSQFKLHYLYAATIGFCVGLIVNYWLSVRWVFKNRKHSSSILQFVLFSLVGIGGLGLNALVMWLLTDGAQVYYLASKVIAVVVVYLWNFSLRKALIF